MLSVVIIKGLVRAWFMNTDEYDPSSPDRRDQHPCCCSSGEGRVCSAMIHFISSSSLSSRCSYWRSLFTDTVGHDFVLESFPVFLSMKLKILCELTTVKFSLKILYSNMSWGKLQECLSWMFGNVARSTWLEGIIISGCLTLYSEAHLILVAQVK